MTSRRERQQQIEKQRDEALAIKRQAQEDLQRVRMQRPWVTSLSDRLKQLRTDNHFGPGIAAAILRRR